MASPRDTAADERTRAEHLRDAFRRSDGWHSSNQAQLGTILNPKQLLEDINKLEDAIKELRPTLREVNSDLTILEARKRELDGKIAVLQQDIDIRKLAMQEAMEVK